MYYLPPLFQTLTTLYDIIPKKHSYSKLKIFLKGRLYFKLCFWENLYSKMILLNMMKLIFFNVSIMIFQIICAKIIFYSWNEITLITWIIYLFMTDLYMPVMHWPLSYFVFAFMTWVLKTVMNYVFIPLTYEQFEYFLSTFHTEIDFRLKLWK